MGQMRVALVDDHPVVLAGISALLRRTPEIEVVGEATNGRDGLRIVQEAVPDIVVVDLSLPDMSGVDLARELASTCPGVRLLVLTVHEDRAYVQPAMRAGARGYVLKRSAAADLLRAIRAVAEGGIYLDPAVVGGVLAGAEEQRVGAEFAADLSAREEAVLKLTAQGFANKEIARQLDVSVKTVDTYKARACEKLSLRSRAAIVRLGVARGWLSELQDSAPV
ncbi:response regulator transcription factor [Enterovirga sp. CN4-39]|uniref:response regulator transcription factor n=1 Tax=Enterovirga sp. CN4-39 TaxID=3400910 RepID=UPI003C11DEC1